MLTSTVQINKGKKWNWSLVIKPNDTFYNVAFLNHILIDGELNTFWSFVVFTLKFTYMISMLSPCEPYHQRRE